jgi:hypothetical protein
MISLLLDFYMRYVVFIMILILIFPKRALMHAMKGVRVAWIVVMIVMISNFMAGMELFRDSFKGLSTRCNIAGLFK